MYYFLREDFEVLSRLVADINERVRQSGQDVGESCRQAAETYHDNAPYEEAMRSMEFNATRLQSLLVIQRNAEIIQAPVVTD